MPGVAELKDIATIVGALLSPFIGAGVAVWTYRRKEREVLHGYIEWTFTQTYQGVEERPFLVIHNRSDRPVMVRDIRYYQGGLFHRLQSGTAMEYEDPTDLHFPYEIEPGRIHRFELQSAAARQIAESAPGYALILARLRRSRVMVEAVTMAGTRLRVSAEGAIPWKFRPEWARH